MAARCGGGMASAADLSRAMERSPPLLLLLPLTRTRALTGTAVTPRALSIRHSKLCLHVATFAALLVPFRISALAELRWHRCAIAAAVDRVELTN